MSKSYIHFLYHYCWLLAGLCIALFMGCFLTAQKLELKSDFKVLLPDNFQSVQDLNNMIARVPGENTLVVAIESTNQKAAIKFTNDLVEKLKLYPKRYIEDIDYNISHAKEFYEKNKYLYMDLTDLTEIRDRLDRKIQQTKLKTSGLYFDFEDNSANEDVFGSDIKTKYKAKTAYYDQYTDGYYFGENGQLMVLIIRPPGTSSGIEFARDLVARVTQTIQEMDPQKYDPSLKAGLTGRARMVLFEYQSLIDDVLSTALLCVCLVGLSVVFYFRRFRAVWLMAWVVVNGVVWTFALTHWAIGYLNAQTAFLGSIIVGNGINYGLIFMARYLEERHLGHNSLEALSTAFPATILGTLISSLTTAVAFGALIITRIKGFSQFGFIGGVGMIACWVSTYSVLPVFLIISEKIHPMVEKVESARKKLRFSFIGFYADNLNRFAKTITLIGIGLAIASVPLLIHYVPNSLEYDFTKLRVKMTGKDYSGVAQLNERVKKIFMGSTSPTVLVTDNINQTQPLCEEILRKNNLDPVEKQVISSCTTVFTSIPDQQIEKLAMLSQIKALLEKNGTNRLTAEQKMQADELLKNIPVKPITLEDTPEAVKKRFREQSGDIGKIVFVVSTDRAPLWNGKNLIHFADIIRASQLPDGSVVRGSGEYVIFADLLNCVIQDGPIATALSFFAVILVIILIYRDKRSITYIVGTLVLGILLMGGILPIFGFKINFFNFIAIPTTFGIGVDYGVNIYQRYKLEGIGSMPKVIRTTGGAVVLCSITTIIGYFTLIIANNQALVSFGWIAIIGELTCLAAALVFIPAVITWKTGHHRSDSIDEVV